MKSIVAIALALSLGACKPSQKNEPAETDRAGKHPAGKAEAEEQARNTILLVKQYAGPDVQVVDYHEVVVPGFALYWVYGSQNEQSEPGYGAAVAAGTSTVLTGKDAMAAMLAANITDAMALARLSLIFREHGGKILSTAKTEAQHTAGVTGPRVTDNELEYWYLSYGTPIVLVHSRLDLKSLEVTTTSTPLP